MQIQSLHQNLTQLTSLYFLDLTGNQLSGPIPSWLLNMPSMQYLYLGSNRFTGPLPVLQTCSNLLALSLSKTTLNVPFQSIDITSCINLQTLDLGQSEIWGTIPDMWTNLPQLSYIHIDGNNLTGSLPPSLFTLTNLQFFVASDNQLSGDLPNALGNLQSLQFLDLSRNQLTGTLNDTVFQSLSSSLQFLQLCCNAISGPIPQSLFGTPVNISFWQTSAIVEVDLSNNLLTGNLTSIEGASYLVQFDASNNSLTDWMTGTSALMRISSPLTYLDLSTNKLTSSIRELYLPTYFRFLKYLFLDNNNWQPMALPSGWTFFSNLELINITHTPLRAIGNMSIDVLNIQPNGPFSSCGTGCVCLGTELPLKNGRVVTVYTDPAYFKYEYCTCVNGYYYNISGTTDARTCAPCLPHATCPGFQPSCTSPQCVGDSYLMPQILIYPDPGFFLMPSATEAAWSSFCQSFPRQNWACNATRQIENGYLPSSGASFACRTSYMGNMCSECAPGYFIEISGYCAECPNITQGMLGIVALLCVIALVYFYTLPPENTGLAKVTANYFNTIMIVSGSMFIQSDVLASFDVLNWIQLDFSMLRCLYPTFDIIDSFHVATLIPLALTVTVAFIYLIGLLIISCGRATGNLRRGELDRVQVKGAWLRKNLHVYLMILSLCYFGLLIHIFAMFRCEPTYPWDKDSTALLRHPYQSCQDPRYKTAVDLAFFYLFLYVIGIPVLLLTLLFYHRKEVKRYMFSHGGGIKSAEANIFGFLYLPYKPSYWWWEAFDMAVRIALTINFCVIEFYSTGNRAILSCVIVGKVLAVFIAHPHQDRKIDALDCFGNLIVLSFLVLAPGYENIRDTNNVVALTILLIACRAAFLAILVPSLIGQFLSNVNVFGRRRSLVQLVKSHQSMNNRAEASADIYSLMERT